MVSVQDLKAARCPCREDYPSGALPIFSGSRVDREALVQAGLVDRKTALVKVLANGDLSKSLTVAVDKVSGGAKKKIEAAGGSVEVAA
jgi:ribosomal protein L15